MKKKMIVLWLIFSALSAIVQPITANAAEVAYKTFIQSTDGLHETQPAYQATTVLSNHSFQQIEDILIDDNLLYVVSSENKKVLVMDLQGRLLNEISNENFQQPTGIALDQQKNLYIADVAAGAVFKLSPEGTLLQTFHKPEEPLFGERSVFKPRKLRVDVRGNMYIIGEGATNGVIQLNAAGEFLGYFGSNMTDFSFWKRMQQFILSEIRLANTLLSVPAAPSNIDIDSKGIVYTVTSVADSQPIKKLNVAGVNMLSEQDLSVKNAIDIKAGAINNFFVLTSEGIINEYSSAGELLFSMGSTDATMQRLGIYKGPSAIAVAENGYLYVADGEDNVIHQLIPTDFADQVHTGLVLFEEGKYADSKEYWEKVVESNSNFTMAHNAIGQSLLREQRYQEAKEAFKSAENRSGYSTAFWEIRHQWMETQLAFYLAVVLVVYILWRIWRLVKRKKGWRFNHSTDWLTKKRCFSDLGLLIRVIRHPLDTFYLIRKENRGSVSVATSLFALFVAEFIGYIYLTGYIFNSNLSEQVSILLLLAIFIGLILLFVGANYLVSTITDGEGSLRKVYIATMYAFAPLLIGLPPVILISNTLTLNEAFLFDYSLMVMVVWSALLLAIMIKEIHNLSFGEMIKNLLLTLFTMIITLSIAYILFILTNQLIDFVYDITLEVITRE